MVLCVFAVLISMMIGFRNVSAVDVHTYKLTLTAEGCSYIQSIGLPVDREAGTCSVKVRFCPNRIGNGGSLLLDDDRRVTASESMLLASEQWVADLPLTSSMKAQAKWAWFWFGLAALFGVAVFLIGRGTGDTRQEKG